MHSSAIILSRDCLKENICEWLQPDESYRSPVSLMPLVTYQASTVPRNQRRPVRVKHDAQMHYGQNREGEAKDVN